MNEQSGPRRGVHQAEIEAMKVKATSAAGEERLLVLGLVTLAAPGLVLAISGGIQVPNNAAPGTTSERSWPRAASSASP